MTAAKTAETTCAVATNGSGEKLASSPLQRLTQSLKECETLSPLQQLTHSLKEWETSGSPKAGIESKLHLESLSPLIRSIALAMTGNISPPPGLEKIYDDVASPFLMDYDAIKYPPPGLETIFDDVASPIKPCRIPLSPDNAKVTRLCWTIDKAKAMLTSGDRIKISPPMDVSLGVGKAPAKFKLMVKPQMSSEGKGGASFKKAKGKCYIELKCEEGQDIIGNTQFSFWVGDQASRGPVEQNFSSDVVGRLPKEFELWDLKTSIGHLPSDPEVWGLKTHVPEGCLVLGVEIRVLPSMEAAPCA